MTEIEISKTHRWKKCRIKEDGSMAARKKVR